MKFSVTRRVSVGLPCGHGTHILDLASSEEIRSITSKIKCAEVYTIECKQCQSRYLIRELMELSLFESPELKEKKLIRIVENDIEEIFIIPILMLFRNAEKDTNALELKDKSAIAAMETVFDFYRIPEIDGNYRKLIMWRIHHMLRLGVSFDAIITELETYSQEINFQYYRSERPTIPSAFKRPS